MLNVSGNLPTEVPKCCSLNTNHSNKMIFADLGFVSLVLSCSEVGAKQNRLPTYLGGNVEASLLAKLNLCLPKESIPNSEVIALFYNKRGTW